MHSGARLRPPLSGLFSFVVTRNALPAAGSQMGGTKNRPCPTAKLPTAIQERGPPPSDSTSPTAGRTAASPTAGAGVLPIAKDGPTKPRREGRRARQTRCGTSFALLAVTIAGLAVLALLLSSASVGWARNTNVAAACNADAAEASVLQLMFCALAPSFFSRHHFRSGGVPMQGPHPQLPSLSQLPSLDEASAERKHRFHALFGHGADDASAPTLGAVFQPLHRYDGPVWKPEAMQAYLSAPPSASMADKKAQFSAIFGDECAEASPQVLEAWLRQLDSESDPALRLKAAGQYKRTLINFKPTPADRACRDRLQSGLNELVKQHVNFKHAVCAASPTAAYYPFKNETEWTAAMNMLQRCHSRSEATENLHALRRSQAEALKQAGCAAHPTPDIRLDDLHKSLKHVPT